METNPIYASSGCPKNVDNSKQIRSKICKDLHISKRISFERETTNKVTRPTNMNGNKHVGNLPAPRGPGRGRRRRGADTGEGGGRRRRGGGRRRGRAAASVLQRLKGLFVCMLAHKLATDFHTIIYAPIQLLKLQYNYLTSNTIISILEVIRSMILFYTSI
jgi:hypothetical protein